MQKEEDCNPQERYLFTDHYYSDKTINDIKKSLRKNNPRNQNDEFFFKFDSWKRKKNELLIYTSFAYADIKIPRRFNCIFDLNNPINSYMGNYEITQVIWNGWFPIDLIAQGHKHLCVMRFEDEIPQIVKNLDRVEDLSTYKRGNHYVIGFCDQKDYPMIKEARLANNNQ